MQAIDTKDRMKRLNIIFATMILLLSLWILIQIIIVNTNRTKAEKANEEAKAKEEQAMLAAMEYWAKGEDNGYQGSWFSPFAETAKIEKKAIEIIKTLENDPETLVFFLDKLEYNFLCKESIKDELSRLDLDLTFEEKLSYGHTDCFSYYDLCDLISQSDIEAYVNQNGRKELHLTAGTGGFYDGQKDTSYHNTVGIKGSPLYDSGSTIYFGDFKCISKSGVRLNSTYHEEHYSSSDCYFKENHIDFDPRSYDDVYFSGKYLFAVDYDFMNLCVYDTEAKCTHTYIFTA